MPAQCSRSHARERACKARKGYGEQGVGSTRELRSDAEDANPAEEDDNGLQAWDEQ